MLNKFCKQPLYEVTRTVVWLTAGASHLSISSCKHGVLSFGRYIAFCVLKEYNILHFGRRRQYTT